MRVFLTLIGADARGATREGILVFVAAIILVAFIAFRLVAIYQPTWAPFLPPVLIALLLLAAMGFGMVVGFLLVEEADSGVRDALAVTPVPTAASRASSVAGRGGPWAKTSSTRCRAAVILIRNSPTAVVSRSALASA